MMVTYEAKFDHELLKNLIIKYPERQYIMHISETHNAATVTLINRIPLYNTDDIYVLLLYYN